MTKNVEIIKRFNPTQCYACSGTGYEIGKYLKRKDVLKHPCKTCKGTGKWNEDTFDIIATQPDGQKIAFRCDGVK